MSKKKVKSEVPQEQGAKDVYFRIESDIDPPLVVMTPEQKAEWILVFFSNGDSFKVAAKLIARDYAEKNKTKDAGPKDVFEAVMRQPLTLVEWAATLTWDQIAPHAIRTERVVSDYAAEWEKARKDFTLTVPEPVRRPDPEPQEQPKAEKPKNDESISRDEDEEDDEDWNEDE